MKHSKNIIILKVKFPIESCFSFHKWKTWLFNGNNHKYTIVTKWHAVFLAYTTGKDFTNLLSSIDHFRYIEIYTWLQGLGNKSKEMYHLLLSLKMISFVFFPQAMQPSMNFNISELVSSTINISFSYVYFKIAALIDSLDILKNKAKH